MTIRRLLSLLLVAGMAGCATSRTCKTPAPFVPLDGSGASLDDNVVAFINSAAEKCYRTAFDASRTRCSAERSEESVRTLGNVFTTVFGTTAGATSGVPALVGSRPTTAQGWVSLSSGVIALGLGIYTQVAADPKRSEGIRSNAETAWERYAKVRASTSSLAGARIEQAKAKVKRDGIAAKPPSSEQQELLKDAEAELAKALDVVLVRYMDVMSATEGCVGRADSDLLGAFRELGRMAPKTFQPAPEPP